MSEPDDAPDLSRKASTEDDRTVIASTARAGLNAQPQASGAAGSAGSYSANAGANTLPPGTRLGEFEIVELIGEGGFGIVYLAYDTSLGRHVALKEYMPSALAARVGSTEVQVKSERHEVTFRAGLKSFINEARILAQFDHHSLVKVYRFWEANGTAYMVMPYYKGVTLKDALKAMSAPPDERWLRTLLAPLLDALAVLHAANCYHRDIAPDNIILLEGTGRPVLLDFGAARRVIGDMTQALTVILKPGYAPIEQYAEVPSLKQGAWSDQYALGALVYFAIVGKTPPPSVGRMVSDSYQPLAGLVAGRYTDRFVRAIDHALAVMPADRPQTAKQFAEELGLPSETAARHGGPPHEGTPVAPGDRSGAASAKRRLLGGAAVALACAAGAGAWWLHSQKPARTPHSIETGKAIGASNGRAAPATIEASSNLVIAPPASAAQAVPQAASAMPPTEPPVLAFTAPGELARIAALADPGIEVKVEVPVPRAVVNRDKLRFSIVSNRAGYLYVFAVDPANAYLQLFPNGLDQDNRIAPGKRIVLPRSSWPMLAGEPLGENHFLAMVSLTPRDFSALGLSHDSVFASLPPAAQEAAAARRTASSSPFAGTAQCTDAASACSQQYGATTFKIEVVRSSK
ncbi:serine/threonine protein kinase [Paraburkholderia flagellata]|uniref:serine/threonine protein kinase n=1 Tax=Paraburkholderia flagellata TaxID=2883241 RepID=UPI001F240A2E|nr:serine/threonine-protein kinase [Paraburkholderia flagellata]